LDRKSKLFLGIRTGSPYIFDWATRGVHPRIAPSPTISFRWTTCWIRSRVSFAGARRFPQSLTGKGGPSRETIANNTLAAAATDCDICEETRCSATTQTSQPMQKGQKTPGKEHKGLFYGGVVFLAYAVHTHQVGPLHRIARSFNICLTPRRCVVHEEKRH
jgi:hypothetical protein